MPSQRLFVAVEVPQPVRDHLTERLAPWQQALPGWRWSDPALWHITLAFLGNVDDELRSELSTRLARVAPRRAPFEVGLGTLGAFSRPARATVIWLGVTTGREELKRLAGPVTAAARRAGVELEERAYRPHLTLGRRNAPADVRDQLALAADLRTPTWTASSYTLVSSHLGPHVRHEPVEEFRLDGR